MTIDLCSNQISVWASHEDTNRTLYFVFCNLQSTILRLFYNVSREIFVRRDIWYKTVVKNATQSRKKSILTCSYRVQHAFQHTSQCTGSIQSLQC